MGRGYVETAIPSQVMMDGALPTLSARFWEHGPSLCSSGTNIHLCPSFLVQAPGVCRASRWLLPLVAILPPSTAALRTSALC